MTETNLSRRLRMVLSVVAIMLTVSSLAGCSLFVMAGKMIFGDPTIPSSFSARTGINLTKDQKKLLVVCRTPYLVENAMPSLEYDLTDGVLRRLKQRGIKTVSPDVVAAWLDENGGTNNNPDRFAKEFDCDFIAIVEVTSLSFYEENSRDMFRGHALGNIRAFEVKNIGEEKRAAQIYSGEFTTEYPQFSPIAIHSMTERVFQKQFLDYLSQQIARHFHDYRVSDSI